MDFLTSLSEGGQFAIQIIIVLICLFYGAKKCGIALGLLGGIGILMLVFAFHIKPGKPAIDVMLTILAVVVASATLQASGGLDVMLQIAERILRRNPKFLTILAPFVTCFLTILCGTGHVVYTIMPIIYDIAIKNGIRPERPMAAASISSQMGIIASPVSVAVVSLTALLLNANHKLAGLAISIFFKLLYLVRFLVFYVWEFFLGLEEKIWIKMKYFKKNLKILNLKNMFMGILKHF